MILANDNYVSDDDDDRDDTDDCGSDNTINDDKAKPKNESSY